MREKKLLIQKWILGTTFRVILLIVIAGAGIWYVVQTSTMSTKGYDMSALKKEVNALEQENRRLAVEIARYRSLQSIQERVAPLQLVAADEIEYLTSSGNAMARR